MTEDQMVGWYHGLNGHEFEQTPGDSEGQGNMACCSSWGCRDSDTTERLNNSNKKKQTRMTQKRKLQTRILDEHGSKNPEKTISKPNSMVLQ